MPVAQNDLVQGFNNMHLKREFASMSHEASSDSHVSDANEHFVTMVNPGSPSDGNLLLNDQIIRCVHAWPVDCLYAQSRLGHIGVSFVFVPPYQLLISHFHFSLLTSVISA